MNTNNVEQAPSPADPLAAALTRLEELLTSFAQRLSEPVRPAQTGATSVSPARSADTGETPVVHAPNLAERLLQQQGRCVQELQAIRQGLEELISSQRLGRSTVVGVVGA